MDLKMTFAILAGKAARAGLRLLRRPASSFPGAVALRLCPDLLRRMRLPEKIVAVTGSNGKTTTTELCYKAARAAGIDLICNTEGSNQIEGVTALFVRYATLSGRVKADTALIESDERFCQYTFSYFAPADVLVTNLYRDQMTRNGHPEFVKKELAKGLPAASRLILNADEPLSASLGAGREAIYFGLGESFAETERRHAYNDGAVCPLCGGEMTYTRRVDAQAGDYRCASCGFARPSCAHEATGRRGKELILDGKVSVSLPMDSGVIVNNVTAAYALLCASFGLAPEKAAEALSGVKLGMGRYRTFSLAGHLGQFILTKHENSMAYDGALDKLAATKKDATLVVIVDQLSRKYTANDMSWLWDIDFERAVTDRVRRVVLGGRFAWDLALRFDFTGMDPGRVFVKPDLDEMMDFLYAEPVGEIYVMTCFTDVNKFLGRLKEGTK